MQDREQSRAASKPDSATTFTSSQDSGASDELYTKSPGPLISDTTTMVTAWELVLNPLSDSLPRDKHLAAEIRDGYLLFTDTPRRAPKLSGNKMTCGNCHLNAGQRAKALPLVGVGSVFPEYNKRAGKLISLEDRIVGCFDRSMNASGSDHKGSRHGASPDSKEVLAIASYIAWISEGHKLGGTVSWRGQNVIPDKDLIPVDKLDRKKGEKLFQVHCTTCHGLDGQGVQIGDKIAGPLWGKHSWNDGAGAARVYTLAGMIRYMMPYLDPGSLSDEEAQEIAAFINSKPRPSFPRKEEDFKTEKLPADAVYYKK